MGSLLENELLVCDLCPACGLNGCYKLLSTWSTSNVIWLSLAVIISKGQASVADTIESQEGIQDIRVKRMYFHDELGVYCEVKSNL